MKAALILSIFMFVPSVVECFCNFPPSLWCSSREIAQLCGVFDHCKEYTRKVPNASLVNFTLYYESLCPDCKNFFASQLNQTWTLLGTNVLNLTLVPYGNAREQFVKGKWEFQCQHGTEECLGNIIDTCAIALLQNVSVYFPFINCMEGKDIKPELAAKECATKMGIDLDPIMNCTKSDRGNLLEHNMALMTDALNPPHTYVPWVTLNGVHTEKIEKEAEEDLLGLICRTYKGPTPQVCQKNYSHTGWKMLQLLINLLEI